MSSVSVAQRHASYRQSAQKTLKTIQEFYAANDWKVEGQENGVIMKSRPYPGSPIPSFWGQKRADISPVAASEKIWNLQNNVKRVNEFDNTVSKFETIVRII